MKGWTSARLVLITVLGGLLLSVAAFAPVYAGNDGTPGNKSAGCNQQKETPDHHYDADCDGSASENGGGGGGGGGKPCAGCVGKADNKHPPGQEPNEDDHNKGYECDDNKGAGAQRGTGNPAHTGCRYSTPSTPPPCVHNCTSPPPCVGNCTSPPPCVHNCTTSSPPPCVGSTCSPSTPPCVGSTCSPSTTPPGDTVSPNIIECDANEEMPGTQVCGNIIGDEDEDDVLGNRPPSELPYTGAALIFVVLAGLGLIGGGIAAVRRTKS